MVKALKDFWIDRSYFYTLGAATYQDHPTAYPGIANCTNTILQQYFYASPEFQLLHRVLCQTHGGDVTLKPGFAYPGFHIFTARTNGYKGSLHVDEPYKSLKLPEGWHTPTSFTLPVELPANGGGLNIWAPSSLPLDLDFHESDPTIPPPDQYLQYDVGVLYKHSGLFYHQIANNHDMTPADARITLQGHTVTMPDGEIIAYF
jgi:hypothetical protein